VLAEINSARKYGKIILKAAFKEPVSIRSFKTSQKRERMLPGAS